MGTSYSASADNLNVEETGQVYKSTKIVASPASGEIVATKFTGALNGNASTATKATQDASGNVITSTYATKTELSNKANSSHNHSASDITSGTLDAARIPNISIDKLIAGTTNTTIPSSLLPSYVDDVLEYTAKANFPSTGATGKIYVDKTTNLTYRWSGSAYVEISPSLALGSTSSTAYRGDYGAAAYKHGITNKGSAFSSGLYKITTNSEGHVTAATAVAKSDITGLGIPGQDTTYSAGTGISLSGTTFSNSGVRSIATGSSNGTISVNTNGTSVDVAVKGLGSNAYTSTEYLPLTGGWLFGGLSISEPLQIGNSYFSDETLALSNVDDDGNIDMLYLEIDSGLSYSGMQIGSKDILTWEFTNRPPYGRTMKNIQLHGNAATATKATQDGNGNIIASTYLPLSGGTMTGNITAPAFIGSLQGYATRAERSYLTYNDSKVYYYNFGGATDLNWKKVASIYYGSNESYVGATIKGIVYYFTGNYNQAEVQEYNFQVNNTFTGGSNLIVDSCQFRRDPGCPDIIRVVRVNTNNYELQVRQLQDWQKTAIQFTISSTSLITPCEPVDSSNNSAISISDLNDSHSLYSEYAYKIKDSGDGRNLTFNYSANGLSSVTWLAGWNGSELRAVSPSVITAGAATTAAKLGRNGDTATPMTFYWSGQDGQPTWLWGGTDGTNMYVYNPSNFSVNYANSCSIASSSNWLNTNSALTYGASGLNYFNASLGTTASASSNYAPTADWYHIIRMNHHNTAGYYVDLAAHFHSDSLYFKRVAAGTNYGYKHIWVEGNSITGAVWNDYAEYRESTTTKPGLVVFENGDDTLSPTTERLSHFAGIVSDTWGFCQGETEKAKTPIAVAGRVLAYTYCNRDEYKPGDCVCAAPNGTVDIMTREEIEKYPDRIVGTVSCVPEYEEWGQGDRPAVKVDGRIWVKVK